MTDQQSDEQVADHQLPDDRRGPYDLGSTAVTRQARATDAPTVAALLQQLGYQVPEATIAAETAATEEAGTAGTDILVADVSGHGVVAVLVANTRRHLHLDRLVTSIDALVVADAHRSEGIGGTLLDAVVERAQQRGATALDLHSNTSRRAARRFYERAGFEVTSNYFVLALDR